jgi:RNA polymerase sigma factor (sigma-70 family)
MSLFSTKSSDHEIIDGIQAGGSQRRQFENKLYYKYNYLIKDALFKHKIEEEEASMAYSDAILTAIEHINNGRFEGRSELKTYIYQIFSNKCVDLMRRRATKDKYISSMDAVLYPLPDTERNAISQLIQNQDYTLLKEKLSKLGDRCQELLNRWAAGFSDKESAEEFGYNTSAVVQTTRLRCLDKLRLQYAVS